MGGHNLIKLIYFICIIANGVLGQNDSYHLPKDIVPRNYTILIKPDIENVDFMGEVTINAEVIKETDQIIFHSSNSLNITHLTVEYQEDVVYETNSIIPDQYDRLIIKLEENLCQGNIVINITYNGSLDDNVGVFTSTTKNGQNIVASKLEPTYARQAFPCWDEPEFKATFDISLTKSNTSIALSNMNSLSTVSDPESGLDTVKFATTDIMSNYLAVFIVGEFEYKEAEVDTNGIGENFPLITYAEKIDLYKTDFALDLGKRAVEFYIQYFEVPYAFPKLGMISVNNYVSGGMEHWGMIIFDDINYLIDNSTASNWNIVDAAILVTHETSHMWVGNLVTIDWWDQIWIQEGFANFMQIKSLNAVHPSWKVLDQALIRTLHYVLQDDAVLSSHPLTSVAETPDQIAGLFDSISYQKGAAVIGMLENFLGEENFRLGAKKYLGDHSFNNSNSDDLYSAMETYLEQNKPDANLSTVMKTWANQMGYPVVTVEAGDEINTYKLTQSRFLLSLNKTAPDDSEFGYRWYIPVTYKTNNGVSENILWFPNEEESVTLTLTSSDEWFKLNNDQVGFFRVNYDEKTWASLLELVNGKPDKLTIADRANLLNDVFALAESGLVGYDLALNFTTFLRENDDFVVWESAQIIYLTLFRQLRSTELVTNFRLYVQSLVKDHYAKIDWKVNDSSDLLERFFRARILSTSPRYLLPEAIEDVGVVYREWLNNYGTASAVTIEPDSKEFVYYYGTQSATTEEWNKLWNIYLNETDPDEQDNMIYALSAPNNEAILKNYFNLVWNSSKASSSYLSIIRYITRYNVMEQVLWDEIRNRWPDITERYTSSDLADTIPFALQQFNTQTRLDEVQAFFAQYPDAVTADREDIINSIKNNIQWVERNVETISSWLTSYLSTTE